MSLLYSCTLHSSDTDVSVLSCSKLSEVLPSRGIPSCINIDVACLVAEVTPLSSPEAIVSISNSNGSIFGVPVIEVVIEWIHSSSCYIWIEIQVGLSVKFSTVNSRPIDSISKGNSKYDGE